jgi:aminobenzoyl-glutamate utilization protein A
MDARTTEEWLVNLRRDLHRHPEPGWREFYTTARIVAELDRIDVDELHVGPEALAAGTDGGEDRRMGVPDDEALAEWYERAREAGADEDVLSKLEGGYTGVVAELHRGDGPTVALRVDIDGLPIEESTDDGHLPAREGFRSETGAMHACGHDGHAAIGLGVLAAVADSDFAGTFKVLFQPAEELVGGGKAVAKSGHLDDVDSLLAVHLGLDHPTGEVIAGIDGFLAVEHIDAAFTGEPSHAGGHPERGRNAVQAMATAVQNLYAIPRHSEGATRVNAGRVEGGTASNIIAADARIESEVRGETTTLKDYTSEKARTVYRAAADAHDCEVSLSTGGEAPSAESDAAVVDAVYDAADGADGVDSLLRRDELGGSEDATYLMREVQANGGLAAYVGVGTDHPGGHHTATFDVDERSIAVGVDVLTASVLDLAERAP